MLEKIYLDDDQVILDASQSSSVDVEEYLKSLGCEQPDKLFSLDGQVHLSESGFWKNKYVPFFVSVNSLWHNLRDKPNEPEHYFVIGVDQQEMDALRLRLNFYFALRSTLKGLCHQVGDDTQPMKYVFFSSKESYLTKLEIPYAMDLSEFESVCIDNQSVVRAETLKVSVQQEDDVHCDERKHVMREAVVEFFKDESSRNLLYLMSNINRFYDAYTERYKVYVSKFSVNKILSEIENERIGFLCKIQDAIMSQQTKAFAIPGSLIAVGAILKLSNNYWEVLVIFIGFAISTWMVMSLNNNVVGHIDLLIQEFKRSISKYDDIVVGVEDVKAEIESSFSSLEESSSAAKTKLNALTNLSWVILIVVFVIFIGRSGFFNFIDFQSIIDFGRLFFLHPRRVVEIAYY
ncbi:conserved protein of unknown function [Pseudomonas marincola]|uniref:Uncharacterized protein n=1 Tax=Pseudomonas marincola TaxID=437900 RepID=A0A653E690_9PSED|nr:hypothetical protein [Pseudomonas marincola]CAE6907092.1 conserved protein of unknown function [Pseudomonas marincola]